MKKIILVLLFSLLFSGVVSASSLNGDYKGNPIVLIKSGGKTLETDEVPAHIVDGHTMVPISTLRQLGVSVTWNVYDYSVDVELPKPQPVSTNNDIVTKIKNDNENAKKWSAENVKYVVDGIGSYVSVDFTGTIDIGTNVNDIATVSTYLLDTDANVIFINVYMNGYLGYYAINRKDVENITQYSSVNDYFNTWKWTPNKDLTPPPTTNVPSTIIPSPSEVIDSSVDGDFEGFDNGKIFQLTNGQIWKQTSYYYYYYYAYSPKVLIYKDGTEFKMKVDGVDSAVTVQRIK